MNVSKIGRLSKHNLNALVVLMVYVLKTKYCDHHRFARLGAHDHIEQIYMTMHLFDKPLRQTITDQAIASHINISLTGPLHPLPMLHQAPLVATDTCNFPTELTSLYTVVIHLLGHWSNECIF